MFDTVVWATDGSTAADRALPFAKRLVAPNGRLVVVHVRELLVGRAGGQPVYADADDIEDRIRGQVEELRQDGFDVTLKFHTTFDVNAAPAIAKEASAFGAGAIVVATRGHGALASAFLGSVTQSLLRSATCPVLAVPPHVVDPAVDERTCVAETV
jgi:nucleotide-binding universal stress UspA family protein